ncbi:SAM-dependent methyltransferase [Blastopirellula marina]|uniref:SAM-dependent methyltransferase n=1 Tax=Blastopirellula marina TaxID=124 RepID=A0A2S8GIP5_9BACT|nr:SAM-dependent methyltransferase [Blastopirellula marina]PQO44323.1 SAM-dependent methyltransferase [Blastopirellula marina]
MPFTLENVVPWGRSFDEYVRMFALTEDDLNKTILGCADGPAAFNAELTRRGGQIVSCDPLYAFPSEQIDARIREAYPTVMQQVQANADDFVWSRPIPDIEALGRIRMSAMQEFVADFPAGLIAGRYVAAELPTLPLTDWQFELALCSHFLFLYDGLGAEFHQNAIAELCRVAEEIRIFPLLQLDGRRSAYLTTIIDELQSTGSIAEVIETPYEFQRGACEMLRIRVAAASRPIAR